MIFRDLVHPTLLIPLTFDTLEDGDAGDAGRDSGGLSGGCFGEGM